MERAMMNEAILARQQLIMKTIGSQIRAQGLTQEHVASVLGVSIPTLKRWLAGKGVSLDSLLRIMSLLNLSWEDMSAALTTQSDHTFTYTRKQELHFVRSPSTLAVFDLLLRGESPSLILQTSNISLSTLNRYLSELEKLNLIERGIRDKITLKCKGEPKWISGGPLQLFFLKEATEQFLSKEVQPAATFGIFELAPSDIPEIEVQVGELKKRMAYLHRIAKFHPSKSKISIGFLLKMAPFIWNRLRTIEET
jgi:transcriptional regulator with XRE-family HTH domain